MALIRIDHVPESVRVNLPLILIAPDPGRMDDQPLRKRKLLYLLHGLSDDASAWQRYTSIESTAAEHGLVVVMPSVGRSFYVDQPNGQNYFTYLTEELPRYLADIFNLSPSREDTFIAGNSMGGYGAMKAALLHPELYSAAASFSGALSLEYLKANPNDPRIAEFALLFGDLSKLSGSPHDPATWIKKGVKHPAGLPRLYVACGRNDDLYPLSRLFTAACRSLGADVNYYEDDSRHNWLFWDEQIKVFIKKFIYNCE